MTACSHSGQSYDHAENRFTCDFCGATSVGRSLVATLDTTKGDTMPRSHGVGRTNAPDTKVKAGGAAGAVSLLLVFIAGELGLDVSGEVAAAVTTLLSFAAAYFKRDD